MRFFLTILFFIFSLGTFAQDSHFTQFYSSPLQLNPSMAGSIGNSRFVASYRNQWNSTYQTQYYSYDQHINFMKGGVGVIFLHDKAGDALFTDRAGLIYSPDFIIKEKLSIKPSLQIDYFQKTIDWSKLTFGDQIDPQYGFIYNTKEIPGANSKSGIDFASGVLVNTKKWNAGFAFHHLTQPDEGIMGNNKLPRKITIHGSYTFGNNDSSKVSFTPALLIMAQSNSTMFLPSVNFKYKKFIWGVGYRLQDAAIIMLGFRGKYFRLGYSYDITVSELKNSGGAHEINLGIFFNYKKNPEKFIAIKETTF